MNIVAATQQISIYGHSVSHSGPLERPAIANFTHHSLESRQPLASFGQSAQKSSIGAPAESTSSALQNEDKQVISESQSLDAVERILEQLNDGKLLSWIDGNFMEKVQAQRTEQQQSSKAIAMAVPAFSAQSVSTSFGLNDGEALLARIARSGIFLDEHSPLPSLTVASAQQQVDVNI